MFWKFMFLMLVSAGIAAVNAAERKVPREKITAHYVKGFDPTNGFDNNAWKLLPGKRMMTYVQRAEDIHCAPTEGGFVKMLWDDNYLYVRGDLEDSDITTSATDHNQHLYLQGDLLEFFIKPLNFPYYWEIYGTPNKLHTAFHFPSRGSLGLPSGFASPEVGIRVDAKLDGTFNEHGDRDRSWSVIIAVPRKELEKHGYKIGPGSQWTMLGARYNYSSYLPGIEYSSFPQISCGYHSTQHYAEIEFIK